MKTLIKIINFSLALLLLATGLIYFSRIVDSIKSEKLMVSQVNQNDISFLNKNDIILTINGNKTDNPDLVLALFKHGKLEKYSLTVLRNGEVSNGEVIVSNASAFNNETIKLERVEKYELSLQATLYSILFLAHMFVGGFLIRNKIWANIGAFSILFLELLYYIVTSFAHLRPYYLSTIVVMIVICFISSVPIVHSIFTTGSKKNK